MARFSVIGILLLLCVTVVGDDLMLSDFETPDDTKVIENHAAIQLTTEHATHGKQAGKVGPGFKLVANSYTGLPADWSAFDQLRLDIFNAGEATALSLWISDDKGNDYYERH